MNEDNSQGRQIIQQAHNLAKANLTSNLERILYEIGIENGFVELAAEKGGNEPGAENENRMTIEDVLFVLRNLVEKGTLTMRQVQMVLQELVQPASRAEADEGTVQAKAAEIEEAGRQVVGRPKPPST